MSLADAIIEKNIYAVKQILQYGVDLNTLDEYGFTPLIEAAVANDLQIAKLLLEYGAEANLADSTGGTALHWAAENNNIPLVRLLLANGANPNSYNLAGQPVLTMPWLRGQNQLKKLLIEAGANIYFVQDYLNTKFMGHLFELVGTANIIDPANQFVEVDFEGFFLEVTLALIGNSLSEFKMHFAGRDIRRYEQVTQVIVDTFSRATQIIRYQQYQVDIKKFDKEISALLQQEPLIIPIGYEGHAITFIKLGNLLVKCDRREESRLYDNIMIYHIGNPKAFNVQAIKSLIYEQQISETINDVLPQKLNLQPITELKIEAQISGNCSWANVEACIPALFFLLFSTTKNFQENISQYKSLALHIFQQWREWSKDRALNFCVQRFEESDALRKLCIAEILAAILFQCCSAQVNFKQNRIDTIFNILTRPECLPILQNYIKSYCYEDHSEEGRRFMHLLKTYDIKF